MRILVVGAGATGGYYGALAARGGAEVTLLTRGKNAAAMQEQGVTVDRLGEVFSARPRIVTRLDEVAGETFDLLLVTVKAPDLPPLLPLLAALGGAVATAQNGVDAEPLAAAYVPAERRLAAVLHLGAEMTAPGHIKIGTRDQLLIGPVEPEGEPVAREVAKGLAAAGVPVVYRADILVAKWAKLVWNNAFNVLTALTERPISHIVRDPELRALAEAMMAEVVEVAHAEGVVLPETTVADTLARGDLVGDLASSTLQDLRAGRPLEHEILAGTIVRRANAHRVPTPVNDILYPLLRARSR
jgi:2-dehydropantoate 2-reductase